ncbi:plasmid mobilization protein [Pseudomonas sp. DSP3-2-2]|uniref:plasmid mobilization protein n=1 Tax=unclassified Pseudomonas TaxID=196821 RepID=UPI003CEA02CF
MSDSKEIIRSVQINATVTKKQREKFNRNAREAGLTNSQFLVALLDKKPVVTAKESLREEFRQLIASLGRINNDLNMLSRYANTYKENSLAAAILHRLNEIRQDVYEVAQASEKLQQRRRRIAK